MSATRLEMRGYAREFAMILESPAPGRCSCFAVRRAARHLTQAYDRHLATAGLRITQYSLLARLSRSGPRTIQLLAREMGLDRTTLGRNLRPLERDGLVAIGIDPHDRRGRALEITPAGRARLEEAHGRWAEAQRSFEAAYGDEATDALHATMEMLAHLPLPSG